jgi:nucleoside-diphosphate-sugar epimerase
VKVFVTGATGALGQHAVPALLTAGHDVTGLARSPEKAAALDRTGARPAQVSLFDREALTEAFDGCDAVLNLATAIPSMSRSVLARSWRANARIRTEGSTAVTDAALAAGVPRLVQESMVMAYPDSGADWIDESVPLDPFPIVRSTPVAESNTRRFADAGRAGVVLRFGLFYGPPAELSTLMLRMARWRVGVVLGGGDGYVSSIHLADAGSAVVAALDAPPDIYNVVDDEPLTKRAYAEAVADAVGRRPLLRGPGRLARLGGVNASTVSRSIRASNRRFREATGWSPRYPSAREGYRAIAATVVGTP